MSFLKMEKSEYKELDFFKRLTEFNPDQKLMGHKRNVILLSSFVLFYYLANVEINGYTGFFIQGKVHNEFIIPVFVIFFQAYNYMMYINLFERKERTKLFDYDRTLYAISIMEYLVEKIIKQHLKAKNIDNHNISVYIAMVDNTKHKDRYIGHLRLNDQSFEIINSKLDSDESDANMWRHYFSKFTSEHTNPETNIHFDYTLTEEDKSFYKINTELGKVAIRHNYMEYIFPKYFFWFSLLVAASAYILKIIKYIIST